MMLWSTVIVNALAYMHKREQFFQARVAGITIETVGVISEYHISGIIGRKYVIKFGKNRHRVIAQGGISSGIMASQPEKCLPVNPQNSLFNSLPLSL